MCRQPKTLLFFLFTYIRLLFTSKSINAFLDGVFIYIMKLTSICRFCRIWRHLLSFLKFLIRLNLRKKRMVYQVIYLLCWNWNIIKKKMCVRPTIVCVFDFIVHWLIHRFIKYTCLFYEYFIIIFRKNRWVLSV